MSSVFIVKEKKEAVLCIFNESYRTYQREHRKDMQPLILLVRPYPNTVLRGRDELHDSNASHYTYGTSQARKLVLYPLSMFYTMIISCILEKIATSTHFRKKTVQALIASETQLMYTEYVSCVSDFVRMNRRTVRLFILTNLFTPTFEHSFIISLGISYQLATTNSESRVHHWSQTVKFR